MIKRALVWCFLGSLALSTNACSSSSSSGSGGGNGGAGATGSSGAGGGAGASANGACTPNPNFACNGNSVSYLCTGSADPNKLTPRLSCPVGYSPDATGKQYCCQLDASRSTCSAEPSAACTGSRTGYSCTGSDTPAQSDGTLTCIPGAPAGGKTPYCCAPYVSATCKLSLTSQGCGSKYQFYCDDPTKPSDADAEFQCGNGTFAINDQHTYCCSAGAPATVTKTCMRDTAVKCGATVGYSCTGSKAPNEEDPAINCGMPAAGSDGKMNYCCTS